MGLRLLSESQTSQQSPRGRGGSVAEIDDKMVMEMLAGGWRGRGEGAGGALDGC